MKGKPRKALIKLLFAVGLFMLPSMVSASAENARIDGKYPLGVSSDYMLTAGNRIRHIGGATMSGRFMANSMAFDKTAAFSQWGIGNNSLNTYPSGGSVESSRDFYSQLWNPAVIINDLDKENTIKDPAFSDPTGQMIVNLASMWPYEQNTDPFKIFPSSEKRVKFITDTPKSEIEKKLSTNLLKQLLDTTWTNNLDTVTEDGTKINGLNDLTQFKDNNITKYQSKNTVPGRSVEQDIQDVSDYYRNLTDNNGFWSSDNRIITDGQSNPQYIAEPDKSVAVVTNIINANDVGKSIENKNSKPVVAVNVDMKKIFDAAKKAGNNGKPAGIRILFNFSKSYYNDENHLDSSTIPYIILNYTNFTHDNVPYQFTWGTNDSFGTGKVKDGKVIDEKFMNEALGVAKGDWNNSKVLWMGSQILNNFNDMYDLDNYPEDLSSDKRDMAGIGKKSAVYLNEMSNVMYGTMLIPHGSFYAGNSSSGLYIGGVIAANNITIEGYGAPISPNHNDGAFGVFGRKHGNGQSDFPDLNNPNNPPETKSYISDITLSNGDKKQTIAENNGTASFDYVNGDLKELPNSGVKASISVKKPLEKYGIYYKLKSENTWNRLGNGAVEGLSDVSINDLESLISEERSFNRGNVQNKIQTNEKNMMGYSITRNNNIEFAISKNYDAKQVYDSDFNYESKFSINLNINGTIEVVVPQTFNMGTEIIGSKKNTVNKIGVNEVKTPYKKVSPQSINDVPIINIYNPMKFNFQLSLKRLELAQGNPFTESDGFMYQIGKGDPNDKDYKPVNDGSSNLIDILKRNDGSSGPIDPVDPVKPSSKSLKTITDLLQSKIVYFMIPYSTNYKVQKYNADLVWDLKLNDQ
ncbi:hypothetical protein [Companilactobacillus sp. DQM5]|uniref:hypothetical protein n=1 Tax=Companilactobacillus sp. DQM5 TaxID=3463359 RepID=UPI004058BBAF